MMKKTMKYERLAGRTKDRLNFITSASFSRVPLLTPSTFSRNMDPVWKEAICGPQKNVRQKSEKRNASSEYSWDLQGRSWRHLAPYENLWIYYMPHCIIQRAVSEPDLTPSLFQLLPTLQHPAENHTDYPFLPSPESSLFLCGPSTWARPLEPRSAVVFCTSSITYWFTQEKFIEDLLCLRRAFWVL